MLIVTVTVPKPPYTIIKTQAVTEFSKNYVSILLTLIKLPSRKVYQETNDQFTVKVADTLEEAVKLMEVGYEYHAEVEGHKLFRKRN